MFQILLSLDGYHFNKEVHLSFGTGLSPSQKSNIAKSTRIFFFS